MLVKLNRVLAALVVVMVLVAPHNRAKTQGQSCPELVNRALASADQSCQNMKRNEACYGNARLEAQFHKEVDLTFSQPADRVPVGDLRSLQTFPLDEKRGLWGVALMNIQANLPDTLPGQAVRFLVYGDAKLTNAGSEQPAAVCKGTATTSANVRSGPGPRYNIVAGLANDTELPIIGRNEGGSWLYASVNGSPGWIAAQLVKATCDLMTAVPVRDPKQTTSLYGPMQAFYFTTGTGQPACKEAPPSSLVVQSPGGHVVKLNINGVEVSVGSTLVLNAPDGKRMGLQTLRGRAVLREAGFVRVIPEGFETNIPLREDENGNPEPSGVPEGLELLHSDELSYLHAIPDDLFAEPVDAVDTSQWSSVDDFCADPQNADVCGDPLFKGSLATCGDGVCSENEYCPSDCGGGTCGDGICDPYYLNESADSCPTDCNPQDTGYCGDGACNASLGEDANTCSEDCGGGGTTGFCGDDVCDASIGEDTSTCATDCP